MKRHIFISLRLTMWFGSVFFAGWVLFGVSMWATLRHTLTNERRQTLARRIDRLQELLVKDQTATPEDRNQDYTDFAHATGNGLAEVFHMDGTLALPSPSILREVNEVAQPIAAQRGLVLSFRFTSEKAIVLADVSALKRLLWILLDNAIKYSRPQGTIRVRLDVASGRANVVVHDDGIGIAPEDIPFIFNRFYRADPSRAVVEGNGLGLAIAQWIAETHEAEITAESSPVRGTFFKITFPRLLPSF